MTISSIKSKKNVLVAVLKDKRDLKILLEKHLYRIPVLFLPKKKFNYVAFYQPAVFGKNGRRIAYYARVTKRKIVKRRELLPIEKNHPRANDDYLKLEFREIMKLPQAIKNTVPRRVSFGFTSLKALTSAKNILEVYGVPPTEEIVEKALNRAGISTIRELTISKNGKRYRLDLAVFCGNKKIAIECDNDKAHGNKRQKEKDKIKDAYLRKNGWRVIRLKEKDISENLDECVSRVRKLIPEPIRSGITTSLNSQVFKDVVK